MDSSGIDEQYNIRWQQQVHAQAQGPKQQQSAARGNTPPMGLYWLTLRVD